MFLVVGDIHFKLNNEEDTDTLSRFLQSLLDNDPTIEATIILGDILHTHEKVHTLVMNRAIQLFRNLAKRKPLYVLVGNHDYINNSQVLTKNHWMNGLEWCPNLTIVDHLVTICAERGIYAVPYVPNGMLATVLKGVEPRCLFAHQEIKGCRMGAIVSEDGDPWPYDGVIISGHVHESQWVGSTIYYPGSSLQHSFADSKPKHVAMVRVEPSFVVEEVNIPIVSRHLYHVTDITWNTYIPQVVDTITFRDKIVLECSKEMYKHIRQSNLFKTCSKKQVTISWKEDVLSTSENTHKSPLQSLEERVIHQFQGHPRKTELLHLFQKVSSM